MANLPTSHDDKLAFLQTARRHGDTISALARLGSPASSLRAYVAGAADLTLAQGGAGALVIGYAGLVAWTVRIDQHDAVEGYAFTGLQPLMEALGIDLSGAPYAADQG